MPGSITICWSPIPFFCKISLITCDTFPAPPPISITLLTFLITCFAIEHSPISWILLKCFDKLDEGALQDQVCSGKVGFNVIE
mgnify:CR=1 FL=1